MKKRQTRFCRVERLEDRNLMAASPVGGELLANSFTYGEHVESPAVAADDGTSLIVFSGRGADDDQGIFARRVTAGGVRGEQFRVNQTADGDQSSPAAGVTAEGEFIVAWSGRGDGDLDGVFMRRFAASGKALGDEGRVNTTVVGSQRDPALAVAPDGGFTIAWSGNGPNDSQGVFFQRFDADGDPAGGETRLNSFIDSVQQQVSLAADGDGNLVAAWSSLGQDGSGWGVFAQRLDADGDKDGNEISLARTRTKDQSQVQVAAGEDGRFVAVWTSPGPNGDTADVFAQRFNAAGRRQGSPLRVNTTTALGQHDPQVALLDDNSFVVGWSSASGDGSGKGVFLQQFDAGGRTDGKERRVNVTTAGQQQLPALDAAGNDFTVAWVGMSSADRDGVLVRRFKGPEDNSPEPPPPEPPRDTTAPVVTARLENDTAISGTNSDRRTSDPAVRGTIRESGEVTRFQARLDATPGADGELFNVLSDLVGGAFRFSRARLEQIAGGALADGRHTLRLVARDAAGNTSATFRLEFTLDTAADATGQPDLAPGSDTGASDSDNITSDRTPVVRVPSFAGTVVRLTVDGVAVGSKTSTGIAEFALDEQEVGDHEIRATATDLAGNVSQQLTRLVVTIDDKGPDTPRFNLAAASDTNPQGNQVTRTASVELVGRTSAGARVRLFRSGGNQIGAAVTADAQGRFSFTSVALALGRNAFTVRANDSAGLENQFSRTITRIDGPIVVAPLSDRSVNEDRVNLAIDLSESFLGEQLTFSLRNNDNLAVLDAAVVGQSLVLDFIANRHGTANLTVRATDNDGKFVEDTFRVTVRPVDDAPTLVVPKADLTVAVNAAAKEFNLSGAFGDADNLGTVVRFNTALGSIMAELFDDVAPITTTNFLKYARDTTTNGGDYNNTIFHRSVPGFVIQGGGFRVPGSGPYPGLTHIATDPQIQNEFRISNMFGTIAMAKLGGNPNSASSEWFINLDDNNDLANANSLDNQNGGFTVFARVLGGGMDVADEIANLDIIDLQPSVPANIDSFQQVPLIDYLQAQANAKVPLTNANMALVNSVTVDRSTAGAQGSDNGLTFSVRTNSNPDLVAASFNGRRLRLQFSPNGTGVANITVRAQDTTGLFVEDTFTVRVGQSLQAAADGSAQLFSPNGALEAALPGAVAEAAASWAAAGLDSARVVLAAADVRFADLPGNELGLAADGVIWIDANAAGHGWFIDATPADDVEFASPAGVAIQNGPAAGKFDLLSVLAHEMGHLAGLDDQDSGDGLMAGTLEAGQRRLPGPAEFDSLSADLEAWL